MHCGVQGLQLAGITGCWGKQPQTAGSSCISTFTEVRELYNNPEQQ